MHKSIIRHVAKDIPDSKNHWIKGINSGKVFAGPRILQLDITNDCNLNCVGCWCHSELMKELKFDSEKRKVRLSFDKIKSLVDELNDLNVQEIQLSGSGDPSMHPDFIKIVEYIKSKGLKLHIITNFTLFTKADIDCLISLEVEKITASVWAGDPATYAKVHPNQSTKIFYRLKENLEYLQLAKNNMKKEMPLVKIYNVISSKNYGTIAEMINFALEVLADYIEFQVIDIVPGKSDTLRLTEKERDSIIKQLKDYTDAYGSLNMPETEEKNKEQTELTRFVNQKSFLPGFTYDLESSKSYNVKCKRGFFQEKIEFHDKTNRMSFYFNKTKCLKCPLLQECAIDKESFNIKTRFLSILGMGSFKRRLLSISNGTTQMYDHNIVDAIPCYIGWTFARILPNGDVIPCCKAHKKPLGNLYKNTFKEIWLSQVYNNFRNLAKNEKKSHPYFKEIGCYKSCDNVGMNLAMHKELTNA